MIVETEDPSSVTFTPTAMYAYHPHYVDAVVNRMRPSDSHVYLADANYNVTALLEPDSTVVERYEYTPYGEVMVLDANFSADADNKSDVDNTILYTGRWRDPFTGLQLNRNRFYHATLGRWVTRDPIGYEGGTLNLYEYVRGMPIYYVDPLGLEKRRQWTGDKERREALCKALQNSESLEDFVNKYDPSFGGVNGYDLFNLEYNTPGYGQVDVDWMITLLAAYYGRSSWLLKGSDPGTIYDIGKRYWIIKDWWTDPNVDLDWGRLNQPNELAAVDAARDLIEGEITLSDLLGINPEDCECVESSSSSNLTDGEKEQRRNERDRRNRRGRNSRGGRNDRARNLPINSVGSDFRR